MPAPTTTSSKPFGIEELLARIRAALRRAAPDAAGRPIVRPVTSRSISTQRKVLRRRESGPARRRRSSTCCASSSPAPGKAAAAPPPAAGGLGPRLRRETEYLRVFINQLRKKIEPDPRHPRYIHTDPWVGYRFELAARGAVALALGQGNSSRRCRFSRVQGRTGWSPAVELVESQIQFQHVHARFAEKSELPASRVLSPPALALLLAHAALACHARHLKLRRGGGNVGIEAGG